MTTQTDRLMGPMHDRVPVLADEAERDVWLYGTADEAGYAMRPYDPDGMGAVPVSAYVIDARNEGPECIRPLVDAP